VGVVTMWTYPADRSQIAPDVLALIFGDIDRRMPDGQRYSSTTRGYLTFRRGPKSG